MNDELINTLMNDYCCLFCKLLDNNYSWAINNFKKDEILEILEQLIIDSDKQDKLLFISAKDWLIEAYEKGEKKYLKNSYDLICGYIKGKKIKENIR